MKKWIIAVICIGMLFLFPTDAFAHSGRTDGNGGHHDGSDYHYHHGYPAHDHWDMDGDGIKDCPYNFVDKTGQNSGTSSSNKKPAVNNTTSNTTIPSTSKTSDSSNDVHPLLWIAVGIFLSWVIYSFIQFRRKEKEEEKKVLAIQESNQKVLQSLNCENISIPKGVVLLPDGTPIRGYTSSSRPYGDYTVYISPKGTRYHTSYRCCPNGTPTHLFKIPKHLLPCRNCASNMQYKQIVPGWYSELTNKTKIKRATVPSRSSLPEGITPITLRSSFIMTAAYAEPVLYLTFKDGSHYAYYQVPLNIYEELINAQSPGRYFQEKIHNVYPYM